LLSLFQREARRRVFAGCADGALTVVMRAMKKCLLAPALLAGLCAQAQESIETVVVTGSVVQRTADEAPHAISVVTRDTLRSAGPMVNLSEALAQVPGLVVNNRSNYAQDLQISSRGFGARAGFGVRGMRLVSDGIPASGPDGQGQVSHFDIAGAQRVEVLRGPFSVLYGNSSGGVIAIFSNPPDQRSAEAALDAGSFGLLQARATLALPLDTGLSLRVSASHLRIDGFRPQSEAQKTQANVRLGWQGGDDTVTLLANHLDQPAQDPLGLARAQFDLGPEQTAQVARDFDTRKTTEQSQIGVSWRHRFAHSPLGLRESQLAVYTGQRAVAQWLAIPAATQGPARHGGGVIDFDRSYSGLDARLRWGWRGFDLVTGASIDSQRDKRLGFENFTGTAPNQVLGVTGRLRRDETNRARTQDVYAQAEMALPAALHGVAGLRAGRVRLATSDQFLSNGDDSGTLQYDYRNPMLGLRWQAAPTLNVFASVARGFESPTLGELAYRADGTGGFNTALQPQTSRQGELGLKWRTGALAVEATVFEVRTTDEIGVATNSGGRSAFQNVGSTLRRGAEAAINWRIGGGLRAQLSGSRLDATYRSSFLVCAGVPCTTPTILVPAGNRIAGSARGNGFAELAWASGAFGEWAFEARALGRTPVNDRNTDFAAGAAVAALRWSHTWPLGMGLQLQTLARIDNLADRRYAGSVIVNDANGRFFEPGAPRAGLVSLRLVAAL
jgi:iron complex outermembrane recepter protein